MKWKPALTALALIWALLGVVQVAAYAVQPESLFLFKETQSYIGVTVVPTKGSQSWQSLRVRWTVSGMWVVWLLRMVFVLVENDKDIPR